MIKRLGSYPWHRNLITLFAAGLSFSVSDYIHHHHWLWPAVSLAVAVISIVLYNLLERRWEKNRKKTLAGA